MLKYLFIHVDCGDAHLFISEILQPELLTKRYYGIEEVHGFLHGCHIRHVVYVRHYEILNAYI